MKLIYVAGPYRAEGDWRVKQNIDDAAKFARELWRRGFAVICPHANSAFMGGPEIADEVFLAGDIEMLNRCDGIFLIPGWDRSHGARTERAFAIEHNIARFYCVADVVDYFSQEPDGA